MNKCAKILIALILLAMAPALYASHAPKANPEVGDSVVVTDASGRKYKLVVIEEPDQKRDTIRIPIAEPAPAELLVVDTRETIVADSVLDRLLQQSHPTAVAANADTAGVDADSGNIIYERNYGRYDRGLFNYLFVPKGQWSFGLTASYGGLQTDDLELLSVITNVNVDGTTYSVKPYVSYFFRNNSSIGMRMSYTHSHLNLNSLGMDMGDDLSFDLSDVIYKRESYSASIFYRHYVGLDKTKRFGIFNEVDLAFGSGLGQFVRNYDGKPRDTRTNMVECRLNFSPGLCVFIQENVSFNVSFGVFGIYFKREKQVTDGVEHGSRYASGADFKFNVFNINLGIAVHI